MAHSQQYMEEALKLAELGRYTCAPNPMVGCVIVKGGEIIGRGWHEKPGFPHAEIHALHEAGPKANGSSVYVSLEPCSHYGRTPPCVEALIDAQVAEVHFPFVDPNPRVSGRSLAKLKAAGINVITGECEKEARQLNEIFLHYITAKRPFVIAKWAMSLDGKLTTHPGDSRKITGNEAQFHLHQIREAVSGILIGSETARQDNPQLTSRLPEPKHQPVKIVLNAAANLPVDLKLFSSALPGKTMVVTSHQANEAWCRQLKQQGVEVVRLPVDSEGKIILSSLLDELGKRELSSLLVEGGETVLSSFFTEGLVNKVYAYLAPVIISQLPTKQTLAWQEVSLLGNDYFFAANIVKE